MYYYIFLCIHLLPLTETLRQSINISQEFSFFLRGWGASKSTSTNNRHLKPLFKTNKQKICLICMASGRHNEGITTYFKDKLSGWLIINSL